MLKQDIRKVLMSPFYYLAIVLTAIFMVEGAWEDIFFSNDFMYIYICSFLGYGTTMVPLLSGLAFADIYCVESRDGYHYSVMVRGSRLGYCISKLVVATLSGFIMMVLSIVLFAAICFVLRKGDMVFLSRAGMDMEILDWAETLKKMGHPELILFYDMLKACVYAAIWPAMSLALSVIFHNKYIIMAGPLLIQKVWDIVFVGLHLPYVSFIAWSARGKADSLPYGGIFFRMGVIGVCLILESIIFISGVIKRME